jgi:hypothetical protein
LRQRLDLLAFPLTPRAALPFEAIRSRSQGDPDDASSNQTVPLNQAAPRRQRHIDRRPRLGDFICSDDDVISFF